MKKILYCYWQSGDMCLGYLEEYPDYMTQGKTLAELRENLKDIYDEMTGCRSVPAELVPAMGEEIRKG